MKVYMTFERIFGYFWPFVSFSVPFLTLSGPFFGLFWDLNGIILVWFWTVFGSIPGHFGVTQGSFGIVLASFWHNVGVVLLSLWPRFEAFLSPFWAIFTFVLRFLGDISGSWLQIKKNDANIRGCLSVLGCIPLQDPGGAPCHNRYPTPSLSVCSSLLERMRYSEMRPFGLCLPRKQWKKHTINDWCCHEKRVAWEVQNILFLCVTRQRKVRNIVVSGHQSLFLTKIWGSAQVKYR